MIFHKSYSIDDAMLRNKKIIFVNFCGILSNTAFHSQVYNLIDYHKSKGRTIDYIGCENINTINHNKLSYENVILDLNDIVGKKGKVFSFPTLSVLLFPLHFIYFLFYMCTNLSKKYDLVCHCRSEFSSIPALMVKMIFPKLVVIHDARGVRRYEILDDKNGDISLSTKFRLKVVTIMEMISFKYADRIVSVSRPFDKYIVNNFETKHNANQVIPCCIDSKIMYFSEKERNELRSKLGYQEEIVICYSGGLQKYQNIDAVLKFIHAAVNLDERFHFLLLTLDIRLANEMVKEYMIPDNKVKIMSVSHNDIYRYYSLSDLAIIIRDDSIVNEVACPIKVGEYFTCGLPILTTPIMKRKFDEYKEEMIVRNISTWEKSDNKSVMGIIEEIYDVFNKSDRIKLSSKSAKTFSFESYENVYSELYR